MSQDDLRKKIGSKKITQRLNNKNKGEFAKEFCQVVLINWK